MKHNPAIPNLIFDLGGVIIDLSIDHSLQSFADLSGMEKKRVQELYGTAPEFLTYEKGLMNDTDFRSFVRQVYGMNPTDDEIDVCWNGMIRGLPLVKLQLLERLKKTYNVFLLSNTNSIHLKYINEKVLPATTGSAMVLDDYFHRTYYSHIMKKRKPHADIFEQVLAESGLKAEETLFLDDNYDNIEGAKSVGIKTFHVVTPDSILDYFS